MRNQHLTYFVINKISIHDDEKYEAENIFIYKGNQEECMHKLFQNVTNIWRGYYQYIYMIDENKRW